MLDKRVELESASCTGRGYTFPKSDQTLTTRRDLALQKRRLLPFILVLFLVFPPVHHVNALGGSTLTAPTRSNVSIDGTMEPSEWSDATHLSFGWTSNNSSLTGGGDVWVKNNRTDLLLGVGANGKTNRTQGLNTYNYTLSLLFDNDNNGVVNNLEDAKALGISYPASGSPSQTYVDIHYDSSQGRYAQDIYTNGTARGSHSNPGGPGGWFWEFAIPMTSALAEDFTLVENASIGFEIVYSEYHYSGLLPVSSGWAYWEVSYQNGFPAGTSPSANGWVVIVRTNLQAPISDNTPPTIGIPTIQPTSPSSSDQVKVSVNVTDSGSGVKNVSITYTTDNWKTTNTTVLASYNITTSKATGMIPALQNGGRVYYYVVSLDNAGNRAVNNNAGAYFSYDVPVPWYLNTIVYGLLAAVFAVLLVALVLMTRRRKPSDRARTGKAG